MNAYVYNADFYCEDCAIEIINQLKAANKPDTHDSNDFPQGPYAKGGGEADTPKHCGKCNEFLENPLTSDGYDYVENAIKEDHESGDLDSIAITVWAPFYEV